MFELLICGVVVSPSGLSCLPSIPAPSASLQRSSRSSSAPAPLQEHRAAGMPLLENPPAVIPQLSTAGAQPRGSAFHPHPQELRSVRADGTRPG